MDALWEVVGGADRGGIIVRLGPELSSAQHSRRLATGSLVACLELLGERLHFRLVTGEGPESGWISIRLKDKDLVVLTGQSSPDPPPEPPPKQTGNAKPEPPPKPAVPQKRIWFVRHGEAEHNVLIDKGLPSSHLRDPQLSYKGMEEARGLAVNPLLHYGLGPQIIISSPCMRALQTAQELSRTFSLKVMAFADLQECTDNPCDTGVSKSELQARLPAMDFTELEEKWFEKVGSNRGDEGRRLLQERCDRVKAWLASRPYDRMVVVAHRTLFAYLLRMDFAPAEVIEMQLTMEAPTGPPSMLTNISMNGPAAGWHWKEVRAADKIFDLYNYKNEPLCSQGSPPLRGTLKTVLRNRGEDAFRNTCQRAGLPLPPQIPGLSMAEAW